jgi:hypothetical protein
MSELPLDAAGRRRSPATLPQFHAGRPPRNKGMRYPADRDNLRVKEVSVGDGDAAEAVRPSVCEAGVVVGVSRGCGLRSGS